MSTTPTTPTTPQPETPSSVSQPRRRRRSSSRPTTRRVRRRHEASSSPAASTPAATSSPLPAVTGAPVEPTETALTPPPPRPPASASALTPEPPLTQAAIHRSRAFLRVEKVETNLTGFAVTYVCACQNRVEARLYDSGYKWLSVKPLFPNVQKFVPQIETVEWTKEKIRIQLTCLCNAGCVFTCYPRQSRGCLQLQLLSEADLLEWSLLW